jgi:uncharacterized protein YacL (UPF0231 family)
METTTIILIIAAVGIIIMIYLRFYKKEKDATLPEQDPRKDEYYDLPATEPDFDTEQENDLTAAEKTMAKTQEGIEEEINVNRMVEEIEQDNKEFDIPEEEITRIIPDEEIEQLADEHEKEVLRINNYFVSNGLINLTGASFFDLQENIILDSHSDHADLYSDIHQIFQLTENSFVAITDLPDEKKQQENQEEKTLKSILGIIKCHNSFGKALIWPYNERREREMEKEKAQAENEEAELVADVFLPVTEIKIGRNIIHVRDEKDITALESLSREIEIFGRDYIAYINGKSIYIRINRAASLNDTRTMMDILRKFQY